MENSFLKVSIGTSIYIFFEVTNCDLKGGGVYGKKRPRKINRYYPDCDRY